MSSLWALFSLPGLSTFCPSPAISITSTSLTLLYPLGLHPAPPPLRPLHQTALPSRSIICLWTVIPVTFSSFPLCLFLLCGALPLRWMCNCESERALCWILNPQPRQSFFLDRICLSQSHHHLQCCRLHLLTSPHPSQPFDCVDNSCLMMGEWQLHFAMCYSHPVHPKAYPPANHCLAPK